VNYQQAMELFEKGCQFGSPRGCMLLADYGMAGPPRPGSSPETMECLLGASGKTAEECEQHTAGAPQWSAERWTSAVVAGAYRRACELGEAAGCETLSLMIASGEIGPQQGETAESLHARACSLSPDCGASYQSSPGGKTKNEAGSTKPKKKAPN
jgi:TPR repeat protein